MKKAVIQLGLLGLALGGVLLLVLLQGERNGVGEAGTMDAGSTPSKSHPKPVVAAGLERESGKGPLPEVDVRAEGLEEVAVDRAHAAEVLKGEIAGLAVDFDPVTGSPKWIGSNLRLLTGAEDRDGEAVAKNFIAANRSVFGHGPEALESARKVTDYTTGSRASRKMVWHQQHEGIDVFEAVLQANVTERGELINIGSQFVSRPTGSLEVSAESMIPVVEAVALAGRDVGESVSVETVRAEGPAGLDADRRQRFRAALLTDADAKLTWVPMNASEMRLAWDVTLTSRSRGEMYRVLVDAESREVLVRQALTAYISDATYRVFTAESPTPFSPGHETPSSLQPAASSRVLVTTPGLDMTASPNGWINDGDNVTSGNNIDAYTDTDADNTADLPRTAGSPSRVFDFPMDPTLAPSAYKDASVTQIFYWSNYMHDRMYQFGFTEAAGNFQSDNFGRGGLGGDPVNAETQDGSGTNNANFSTPVDGSRGRMQMFVWTYPNPDRDSSFDTTVLFHEYGHGVSNRLVGGPSITISQPTSRGMGEGWSDYFGLALLANEDPDPHGNRPAAAYLAHLRSGWFSENYYYGLRRYSYSTDMRKNPLTFKDIDPTQMDLHIDVSRNPTFGVSQDATQVHYQGTVWCTMLNELRANLVLKHGATTGNDRALFLVTEGMKLGPANPNFVQSRDGIVQAAMVNHPEDLGEVWSAFAKRGLGSSAQAPSSSSSIGVLESFDVPDPIQLSDRSGWTVSGKKGGDFTSQSKVLTLTNSGVGAVDWSINTDATWLVASPVVGTLAPGASVEVTLTPQAALELAGFHNASVTILNETTGFDQTVGFRLQVNPPAVASFDLDTDPGWSRTGQWAYGTPTGGGGAAGNPDPVSGATGSSVFGVNLSGDVGTNTGGPYYLTLGPLDLTGKRATRLRFKRWLNTNAYSFARATVEVSTNGTDWREVFSNPGSPITDNSWVPADYDLSSVVDDEPTVYVRWGYRTLSASYPAHSGWNIDDVEILAEPTAQLNLTFADNASEGDSILAAQVSVDVASPDPVVIHLSSIDPTAATVPASVVLPAGQLATSFDISLVNDPDLDGTQVTEIVATAPSVLAARRRLSVHDNEVATLTLSLPASVTEGMSNVTGSVTSSAAPVRAVEVRLVSDEPGRFSVPYSVVLPQGSTGPVVFPLNAIDNSLAEGSQSVGITAMVQGWEPGTGSVIVTDDEAPAIVLSGPLQVREADGATMMHVSVNTLLSSPLEILLNSSDVSEVDVPASVVVPAGTQSATFEMTVVDDSVVDGSQAVRVEAQSAGYGQGFLDVSVKDNEIHHFGLSAVNSQQLRNRPFEISLFARDLEGDVVPTYTGSVVWGANGTGGPLPFSAELVTGFAQGVARYSVTLMAADTGVVLSAGDGVATAAASNAFDVAAPLVDRFEWSELPSSSFTDQALPVSLTALDDEDQVAAGFAEPVVLEAWVSGLDRVIGSTTAPGSPLVRNTAFQKSRVQLLYTASQLGSVAQWLTKLEFHPVSPDPGQPMENFRIRVKQTSRTQFGSEGFDASGWTTVFQSDALPVTQTTFDFSEPFYVDGTQSLLVDVSFSNSSSSTAGDLRATPTSATQVLFATGGAGDGDPLLWSGSSGPAAQASTALPTVSVFNAESVGELPASPAGFVDGVWNGVVHNPSFSTAYFLAKGQSGITSFSGPVSSQSPSAQSGGSMFLSETFSTSTLASGWLLSGMGSYRSQVTSNYEPIGSYHLTMDSSNGSFARNEVTRVFSTAAGRSNFVLRFSAKEFADEPHVPPSPVFTDGADFDGVAVSPDGVQWAEVRGLRDLTSSYSEFWLPLDPVMQRYGWAYSSDFQIRFNHYDNSSVAGGDGIAIDNVYLYANHSGRSRLEVVGGSPIEGNGPFQVIITAASSASFDRTAQIRCDASAKLQVPVSVFLPAGQTSVQTEFIALDDEFADGFKDVLVLVDGFGSGPLRQSWQWLGIEDDETTVMQMSVPAQVTEGGQVGSGVLTLTPPPANDVEIALSYSDTSQISGTTLLTYRAGESSATFSAFAVNDTLVDGTFLANVTATQVTTGVSASGTVEVLDNDVGRITLSLPDSVTEGGGTELGTVLLSQPSSRALEVQLASSPPGQVVMPASVLVPPLQYSATFQIAAFDDGAEDGTQTAQISASAAGYTSDADSMDVLDNDAAYFEISGIPDPATRNAPVLVTLTARTSSGQVQTLFNGSASMQATAQGMVIPVSPAGELQFQNGVWSGEVRFLEAATHVVLSVSTPGGAFGQTSGFDVLTNGPATSLAVSLPATDLHAGSLAPVRVHAVDENGWRVNGMNGPVTISLVAEPGGQVVAEWTGTLVGGVAEWEISLPSALTGVRLEASAGGLVGTTSTFGISQPATLAYPPQEVLFEDDFESGEFGPEWTISGTGNHRTTLRTTTFPHTGSFHLVMDSTSGAARNEATLSLNLDGRRDVELLFWAKEINDEDHASVDMPFVGGADFDGIAISEDGSVWHEVQPLRTGYVSNSWAEYRLNLSDLAEMVGMSLSSTFGIRFNHFGSYSVNSDGLAFDDIRISANAFPDSRHRRVVFEDNFDSGVFHPAWTITGTGNYRTQVTEQNGPLGARHMVMDAIVTGNSRNEATLALDLRGMQDARLRFWMKENSDENDAPPSSPFTGGADFDGVAISADGVTWYEVRPLRSPDVFNDYRPFSVDLDSAIVAAGIDYNSAFQVRFNHFDNSPWSSNDGFAFDLVQVSALPPPMLGLNLPETLLEGTSAAAQVNLSASSPTDVVVTLRSNRAGFVSIPDSFTIPAGQLSASFDIAVSDDAFLTGSQVLEVEVSMPGSQPAQGSVMILDNEGPEDLVLLLPASLAEGGAVSGILSIPVAGLFDLVVDLEASYTQGLVIPSSVVLPAGSTEVSFLLERSENNLTLEASETVLTATAGNVAASQTVALPDNDPAVLVMNAAPLKLESDESFAGSISFDDLVTAFDLELALVSSHPASLMVPASVVIPAGSGSVDFSLTPIDNLDTDGARMVTVTAHAEGVSDAVSLIEIRDEDLHHFEFSSIASPQVALQPFSFTVQAWTVDGYPAISAPANLSAESGGNSISLTPTITGSLSSGEWTGDVTVLETSSDVTLTSAVGGVSQTSNVFDVEFGPRISVNPISIQLSLPSGESTVLPLTVTNPGQSELEWRAEVLPNGTPFVDPPLATVLSSFNSNYAAVSNSIAYLYEFADGVSGSWISDGGYDLFDSGNLLRTSLSPSAALGYQDGIVTSSSALGTGGQYFTRKRPGLFVFVGDLGGIDYFEIAGGLGQDGAGATDSTILATRRFGVPFKAFIKRVFGASNPSLNHMFVVRDQPALIHDVATDTDDDYHRLSGLGGANRLYYLMFSTQSGRYVDDEQMRGILEAFLDSVLGPEWIDLSIFEGLLPAGDQVDIDVRLDAHRVLAGSRSGLIRFTSNDPTALTFDVPVQLNIQNAVASFGWSIISPPQTANVPFVTTLTAKDVFGNQATGFNGIAEVTVGEPPTTTTSGLGTSTITTPLDGTFHENRVQAIYEAAEVGPAGRIRTMNLQVWTWPGSLNEFTVRLKHTAKPDYSDPGSDVWETDGWHTVFRGTLQSTYLGWVQLKLDSVFDYDGISNLMVDLSFDNDVEVGSGGVRATMKETPRALAIGKRGSHGSPLHWFERTPSGAVTNLLPNLQFEIGKVEETSPTLLQFSNGQWAGELSVPIEGQSMVLRAEHAEYVTVTGESNPFEVGSLGTLVIDAPVGGVEGDQLLAEVRLSEIIASDLVVYLSTDSPSLIDLPPLVQIPAGQQSSTFQIMVLDDDQLNGERCATISASAPEYGKGDQALKIHDNESTTVTLVLPTTLDESTETVLGQGAVQIAQAATHDLWVRLSSSKPQRLGVPGSVRISKGESIAFFGLAATDNELIDGNELVNVTADLTGSPLAADVVEVIDDERKHLYFTLPATNFYEGEGSVDGVNVKVLGIMPSDLTVQLTSTDETEMTLPAMVTIPAGQSQSAPFSISIMDDVEFDGSEYLELVAAAEGFESGYRSMRIDDDDASFFSVSAVGSPQIRNRPFTVVFQPKNIGGQTIQKYKKSAAVAVVDGANTLASVPMTVSEYANGIARVEIVVGDFASNAVISITDPETGGVGYSNPFSIGVGRHATFGWSNVSSPQFAEESIPVVIVAQDNFGNPISSFSGSASLSVGTERQVGKGDTTWYRPLGPNSARSRTQMIFDAGEIGGEHRISSLSLNVASLPSGPMDVFTIRLKHTPKNDFSEEGSDVWESSGWTTCFQGSLAITETGWLPLLFSAPFDYNGIENLMIDVSYNNVSSGSYNGTVVAQDGALIRSMSHSSNSLGDPLFWTGTYLLQTKTTIRPVVKLGCVYEVAVSPLNTGPFANGAWAGQVTLNPAVFSPEFHLQAASLGALGLSNEFETLENPLIVNSEPLFSGGGSNLLSWNEPAPALEYEIETSQDSAFTSSISSGFISEPNYLFYDLVDGCMYYYRARMRRSDGVAWTSGWSNVVSSTQDASPPVIITNPADEKYTAQADTEIGGTAADATSGLALVTVDGAAASTSDGFANWTKMVLGLAPGSNTVTVEAADNAVPPNTASVSYHIFRIEDATGQTNADGVPDLLNHALHLDAPGVGRDGLPAAVMQHDDGDDKTYLTLQYRRRIHRAGFRYIVETSSTLAADGWDDTGASVEEVDVTPNADGVTETCTVRITPAIGDADARFVRLRVEVD